MLSPRAIATQGLGFTSSLVAVQGLGPVGVDVLPPDPGIIGARTHRRIRIPSFVQLVEEDELMLMCVAGLLTAGLLS